MDCSICQETMGIAQFESGVTVDTELPEHKAFRLKCGHAFHTSCLCMSLRSASACPTCGTDQEEEIVIDVTQPMLQLTEAIVIVDKLEVARKEHKVQLMRRNINNAIKQFRYVENSMLRKRKYALEHTGMRAFRREYRETFEHAKNKLQKQFNKLKEIEFSMVLDKIEDADERAEMEKSLKRSAIQDYSVYCLFAGTFGPLKYSFWR